MKTTDLNLLDALMEKAIKRYSPADILRALDYAVEQNLCVDEEKYAEVLYDNLVERWSIDGIVQQIVDYNEDFVIKKVDNIHDKYQVEQLIKSI